MSTAIRFLKQYYEESEDFFFRRQKFRGQDKMRERGNLEGER